MFVNGTQITANDSEIVPNNLCLGNVSKDFAAINMKKKLDLMVIFMSRTNETRHIEWHETCKCKCRLDGSVCNNKQRWNEDKCRYECK